MGYTPQRLRRQVEALLLAHLLAAQNEYHPGWTSTQDIIRAAAAQSAIGPAMWRKEVAAVIYSGLLEVDHSVPGHVDRRRQWVRLTDAGRQVAEHAQDAGPVSALRQQQGQQILAQS